MEKTAFERRIRWQLTGLLFVLNVDGFNVVVGIVGKARVPTLLKTTGSIPPSLPFLNALCQPMQQ